MKTALTIIGILLITFLAVILAYRGLQENTSFTDMTVMRDITETQNYQPQAVALVALYDLDNCKWDGGHFRFVDITDVSYNHSYEATLKPENKWMGNEFDREKTIKGFSSSVSQTLNTVQVESSGRTRSSIYLPIVMELNRLSLSTASRRILIIYSDLMENTIVFSMYSTSNLDLLKTHPQIIRHYLESLALLNNLSGIKVYLIYEPKDNDADQVYKAVSGIYKSILESKGATVEISANIN